MSLFNLFFRLLQPPLLGQLPPGGQVVSAELQHGGHGGEDLGQQGVAGDADPTEESHLKILITMKKVQTTQNMQ